jgi:hypothetical protein
MTSLCVWPIKEETRLVSYAKCHNVEESTSRDGRPHRIWIFVLCFRLTAYGIKTSLTKNVLQINVNGSPANHIRPFHVPAQLTAVRTKLIYETDKLWCTTGRHRTQPSDRTGRRFRGAYCLHHWGPGDEAISISEELILSITTALRTATNVRGATQKFGEFDHINGHET